MFLLEYPSNSAFDSNYFQKHFGINFSIYSNASFVLRTSSIVNEKKGKRKKANLLRALGGVGKFEKEIRIR